MASPNADQIRHRTAAGTDSATTPAAVNVAATEDMKAGRQKKAAMAKRGLKSLGLAIGLPFVLSLLDILLFGSSLEYATMAKPIWYPPLWALHLACLLASSLMGLSAWMVWAEGGFHRNPTALILYLGQMGLGLVWGPIVFRAGAARVGLAVCFGLFGALIGCARTFRSMNPIAGDLVKPCLLWAVFVTLVNVKLVYLSLM